MAFSKAFLVIIYFAALATTHYSFARNLEEDNFKEEFLTSHNDARAEVGIEPVTWNATVEQYAMSYANKRTDCKMQHSEGPYGENLAMSTGDLSPSRAVKLWVDEKSEYDYDSNSCAGKMCGHYTQVVWRDTKQIGCARVKCNNGGWFVTCNYYPPGNYVGEHPY